MVKELTQIANIERQKKGNDVYWLLEIDFPDKTRYYSTRGLVLDGRAYEPVVIKFHNLESSVDSGGIGCVSSNSLKVEVYDDDKNNSERLSALMIYYDLIGLTCRVGLLFKDKDNTVGLDDITYFQQFAIKNISSTSNIIELDLVDHISIHEGKKVGRVLNNSLVSNLSDRTENNFVPIIFGKVQSSKLIPLRIGNKTKCQTAIEEKDKIIYADDVSLFPPKGKIVIGIETIEYPAVDYEANTFGTSTSPLKRTTPMSHNSREAIFEYLAGGYDYITADHPCYSISNINSLGVVIPSSKYQAMSETIDGSDVQKIRFPQLPSVIEYEDYERTLNIDGKNYEGYWQKGENNTSKNIERAFNSEDITTYSTISKVNPNLHLMMSKDLSSGAKAFGKIASAKVGISYFCSKRWNLTDDVSIEVKKNSSTKTDKLKRPSDKHSSIILPAHSHENDITFTPSDSRELFDIANNIQVFNFDKVEGEFVEEGETAWADGNLSKDGDLDTYTQSYTNGSIVSRHPIKFTSSRGLMKDDSAEIKQVRFKAIIDTDASPSKTVKMHSLISDKYNQVDDFTITTDKAEFSQNIEGNNLSWDDLNNANTSFELWSADGDIIRLYEAWLEVEYKAILPGQATALALQKSGSVKPSTDMRINIPSPMTIQKVDITDLVNSSGDWDFFKSISESDYPQISINFPSSQDTAEVYITGISLEVEYYPIKKVTVFDEFSADISGVYNESGVLENPADIIKYLLTNPAFMGLDEAMLDADSFAEAKAALNSLGYKFARKISSQESIKELLDEAAFESKCRLHNEGTKLKLSLIPDNIYDSESVFSFSKSNIIAGSMSRELLPADDIFNSINLYYNKNTGLKIFENPVSSNLVSRDKDIHLKWLSDSTGAQINDLGEFLINKYSQKKSFFKINTPLESCHVEICDPISLNYPALFIDNFKGEVLKFKKVLPNKLEYLISIISEGTICWIYDIYTYIRHAVADTSKYFNINGMRVAELTSSGELRLKGSTEAGSLEDAVLSQAISYDAISKIISFGTYLSEGQYSRCFAIDEFGNLFTKSGCDFEENATISGISVSSCYQSLSSSFIFSLDIQTPILGYITSGNTIKIKGTISENYKFLN